MKKGRNPLISEAYPHILLSLFVGGEQNAVANFTDLRRKKGDKTEPFPQTTRYQYHPREIPSAGLNRMMMSNDCVRA